MMVDGVGFYSIKQIEDHILRHFEYHRTFAVEIDTQRVSITCIGTHGTKDVIVQNEMGKKASYAFISACLNEMDSVPYYLT